MIEYDYLLERDIGGGRIQKLQPSSIPSEIPNLLRIEGPNSIGKSTLLNIIALGFWGTESRKIHPALLEKMSTLLSSDYQRLKFRVKIESEKESLVLVSNKPSLEKKEIMVEESVDGKTYKPITRERFESKYNLIYDIASNPIERLYDLLKDLREEERQFGNRFKDFGSYLRRLILDIDSSRNQERLNEVIQTINRITQENVEIKESLPALSHFLDVLEINAYVYFYYYYLNQSETLTQKIAEYEQKGKSLEKGGQKIGSQLLKCRREIESFRKAISEQYQEVTPLIKVTLPKNQKNIFKIWRELNQYSTDVNDLNAMRNEAVHLRHFFQIESEKIKKESSFQDANVLKCIVEALQDFENSSLVIPKLKVTLGELINILKEENKRNFLLMSQYENTVRIDNMLGDLVENVEKLLAKLEELKGISEISKKVTDETLGTYFGQKDEIRIMREDLKKYEKKCKHYLQKCISKNLDESKLENLSFKEFSNTIQSSKEVESLLKLTEEQVMQKIGEIENDILQKKRKLVENGTVLTIFQREKSDLEKQEPHRFAEYREEIVQLLQKADNMSQRLLATYDDNIKSLIEKKVNKHEVEKNPAKKKYFEEISRYLAYRIGIFPHMEKKYKAAAVDLISGIIVTDDGTIIRVKDIGTGQSQSAYLMSLLNVADDGRKIIALFDEIAMMDDKSLEPVCKRIIQLFESKRLLVGILVQKSEQFKLKALV